MDLGYHAGRATRHVVDAILEGALIVAIVVALMFAVAVAGGSAPSGAGSALAGGGRLTGKITVQVPVAHGESTTAIVNPGGANVYVFVQCYNPDYVFAAYYSIDANNQAMIGPLWATTWQAGGGDCTAKEGYFRRDGFGKWVTLSQTSFTVDP